MHQSSIESRQQKLRPRHHCSKSGSDAYATRSKHEKTHVRDGVDNEVADYNDPMAEQEIRDWILAKRQRANEIMMITVEVVTITLEVLTSGTHRIKYSHLNHQFGTPADSKPHCMLVSCGASLMISINSRIQVEHP